MRRWRLNSGYSSLTDQRRTIAGTVPMLKHNMERNLGFFSIIVESGLILYLDAGNVASYPGSGTVWTDLSGSGNNGTLTSGPTYSSLDGGYINFDGSNDSIVLPAITPTTAATFNAWIYINGSNANYGVIFSNWGSGGNAYFIGTNPTPNESSITVYFNDSSIFTITSLSLNTWMMFTVTHNNASAVAYINGVQTNSGNSTLASATNVSSIGYDTSRNGYPFKGKISQALIYNRALSAAEVKQNYNALTSRYGL